MVTRSPDSVLQNLFDELEDPVRMLEFHQRIVRLPDGGRFSLSGSPSDGPYLYTIGRRIQQSANSRNQEQPSWLAGVRAASAIPEPFRKDAHAAISTYIIGDTGRSRTIHPQRDRAALAKLADLPADAQASASLIIGITGWNDDDAATRKATVAGLLGALDDAAIDASTRYQFAVIALQKSPRIATEPAVAASLANLFEQYAATGRSVVNPLVLRTMNLVSITPFDPATADSMARINTAFWKNAGSPVPAGHTAIPPSTVRDLFLAAAFAGDEANANRLLGAARGSIQESPAIIARLIQVGRHELAKRVLPPRNVNYRRLNSHSPLPYTRQFEESLNTFRISQNIPPFDMLRLEAQFKGDAPYPTGASQPAESETDREIRLAQA